MHITLPVFSASNVTIQEAIDYIKSQPASNAVLRRVDDTDVGEWMDNAFRYIDKNYADLVTAGVMTDTEQAEKIELLESFNAYLNGDITVTL